MGQATIDLPDPLDLPPVDHQPALSISAAALASADDLLSQLAGEDIDRLLAEAESADQPSATEMPAAEMPVAGTPAIAAHESHTDFLTKSIGLVEQSIAVEVGQDVEATVPQAIESVAERIAPADASALQSMIELPSASMAIAASETTAEAGTPLTIVELQQFEAAPVDAASELPTPEERRALVQAEESAVAPPSILVRLLQILNSPTAWLPDALRDALGKVALLTMFNAIAVLGYVLLFRGKHPH